MVLTLCMSSEQIELKDPISINIDDHLGIYFNSNGRGTSFRIQNIKCDSVFSNTIRMVYTEAC